MYNIKHPLLAVLGCTLIAALACAPAQDMEGDGAVPDA